MKFLLSFMIFRICCEAYIELLITILLAFILRVKYCHKLNFKKKIYIFLLHAKCKSFTNYSLFGSTENYK